jgi:hypothetical protein
MPLHQAVRLRFLTGQVGGAVLRGRAARMTLPRPDIARQAGAAGQRLERECEGQCRHRSRTAPGPVPAPWSDAVPAPRRTEPLVEMRVGKILERRHGRVLLAEALVSGREDDADLVLREVGAAPLQ